MENAIWEMFGGKKKRQASPRTSADGAGGREVDVAAAMRLGTPWRASPHCQPLCVRCLTDGRGVVVGLLLTAQPGDHM